MSSSNELYAVADFCLIPMGLDSPSVGPQIAECQRVLEKSGLTYKLHGYGTNLEGPWSAVTKAIGDCHAAVHAMGTPRIATDIRIGTRTDKQIASGQGNLGKVGRVEEILAAGGSSQEEGAERVAGGKQFRQHHMHGGAEPAARGAVDK